MVLQNYTYYALSQCRKVISIWNQLHLIPEDMRGIGIQISRLELGKKQNKDNLVNFFNKMEKLQPCDKIILGDNKNQCDSNLSDESKPDSSKISLSTKSSATIDVSDTRNDKLQLKSAQINSHKNGHVVTSDIRAKQSAIAVERKDKNLHRKTVDDVKIRDSSWKSNKKVMQKQTSQENFFKHTKPKTENPSKYEIPRMQDIDMSVLVELPEDIRNEIFDEYKRNKKQCQINTAVDTAKLADVGNEIETKEERSDAQNCSQVDLDVLSALLKSNLHPDVQRDVQTYCDMKKGANKTKFKQTNKRDLSNLTEQLQQADPSVKVDNGKSGRSIRNNTCTTEAASMLQEDVILHAKDHEKDTVDKTQSLMSQVNRIEISRNNTVMDKADTFILQNLSILHNNENVDKHQEMLITLVNHLFTLPLHQVPHNYLFKQKILNIGTEFSHFIF